jgi:hypothetical protein
LASGIWRASANISAMACSAVVIELPNGRVHHDHALGRSGIGNIDIVDADAGAADDLQVGRGVEDFLRHLGRAADGEAIIFADDRFQLFRSLAGDDIDVAAAIGGRSARRWGPSCRK